MNTEKYKLNRLLLTDIMSLRFLIYFILLLSCTIASSQNVFDQILLQNSDSIVHIDILEIQPTVITGRLNTKGENKIYFIENLNKVYIHEKSKSDYLLRVYSDEPVLDSVKQTDLFSPKPLGKLKESRMSPVLNYSQLLSKATKPDTGANEILFNTAAHIHLSLSGIVTSNIKTIRPFFEAIDKGTKLKLIEIGAFGSDDAAKVIVDGKTYLILLKHIVRIEFQVNSIKEFWQLKALESGTYKNILNNGLQLDKRYNVHQEVLEYRNYLNRYGLFFEDAFLESHIQSLVFDIFPTSLDDGRKAFLTVKIVKDDSPNAFIYADGSMFITTKLLSMLRSEEELYAILAHEISHFVLDHSIVNVNKQEKREKRAKFWSAFATGMAAIADGYLAAKVDNYSFGPLTLATATISFGLSSQIVERLGAKYSQEQELESDKCAEDLLSFKSKDPAALSSALKRIEHYFVESGNHQALLGEGSHPTLKERIKEIGQAKNFEETRFDVLISLINSFNIQKELEAMNYKDCIDLVQRNIKADVATQNDYLALAISTIYLNSNEDSNLRALQYLSEAKTKELDPVLGINKYEAIAQFRLNQRNEAKASLERYKAVLKEEIAIEDLWQAKKKFLIQEISWTDKMIDKLDKL
ncbi:MAG: M48 family metalloprotease [Bacteroidia bacterium]|nr:M48 family metalloprotease [Bacteroidia bacterium]